MSIPKTTTEEISKRSGIATLVTKPLHNLRIPKPLKGKTVINAKEGLVDFYHAETAMHITLPMDSVICVSWE